VAISAVNQHNAQSAPPRLLRVPHTATATPPLRSRPRARRRRRPTPRQECVAHHSTRRTGSAWPAGGCWATHTELPADGQPESFSRTTRTRSGSPAYTYPLRSGLPEATGVMYQHAGHRRARSRHGARRTRVPRLSVAPGTCLVAPVQNGCSHRLRVPPTAVQGDALRWVPARSPQRGLAAHTSERPRSRAPGPATASPGDGRRPRHPVAHDRNGFGVPWSYHRLRLAFCHS